MELIFFCIIYYLIYVVLDFIPIFKRKQWNYIWFYLIIFLFAFTIGILDIINVNIPSPAKPIEKIVKYIFHL